MKIRNIKNPKALLVKLNACPEAIAWVGKRDMHTALKDCERADWLLWLAAQLIGKKGFPTHKQVVKMACICARTALEFVPKGEDRPRKAIETAEAWIAGKATIKQVRAAVCAADAAYAADAAVCAAVCAADAAVYAAYAADAAAFAAGAAADRDMCNLLREYLEKE